MDTEDEDEDIEKTYFDNIPIELKALIQLYLTNDVPSGNIIRRFKESNKDEIINYYRVVFEKYVNMNYYFVKFERYEIKDYPGAISSKCYNKEYWKLFYSLFIKDWKLIIDNKPIEENYIEQYLYLLNSYRLITQVIDGRLDSVIYLINKGININEKDYYGNTAIKYAVEYSINYVTEYKYFNIVKYLIEHGANIKQHDGFIHQIILMYSFSKRHSDIIEYLNTVI